MLSTAIYVIEIGKDVPVAVEDDAVFFDYRGSARSTLISALANVTAGGNPSVLVADLEELKSVILSNSYQAMLRMDYSLQNSDNYSDGLWIFWGTNGMGISSSYVSFSLGSSTSAASSNVEYVVNVTSTVHLTGSYTQLNETQKQVNLSLTVSNEDHPALASNLTWRYLNATEWVTVASPTVVDFGDGSYAANFIAETGLADEPLEVSLLCLDQRGITVSANLTCNHT